LRNIPSARLFEEVLKLFMGGSATATFELMRDYRLLAYLFPGTEAALEAGDPIGAALIEQTMVNTDKRVRSDKTVTPAFIYAALLWPALQAETAPPGEAYAPHPGVLASRANGYQPAVGSHLVTETFPAAHARNLGFAVPFAPTPGHARLTPVGSPTFPRGL
jgi:poly(A) polymerase